MAGAHNRPDLPEPGSAAGLRIGLIRSRWNSDLVDRLAAGAEAALQHCGVSELVHVQVAGALELPFAANVVARSGRVDAIVAMGAVVRGETTHYEIVSQGCAAGLQQVQLETQIPVTFGVLTVENEAQALARSQPFPGANAAADAALAAVELAQLAEEFGRMR